MIDQYQTPPMGSLDALKEAADNLHPSHSSLASILDHLHDYPQEHSPHAMYVAGLKDMASTDGLSKATIIGWRYLSDSGGDKKYAVEVHHDPDGSNHRFAGLNHGLAVEELLRVIKDEKIRKQVESGAFTLSTLSIPSLDISAVWLRATSGGNDILVVVPPAPSYLKPWPDVYTVEQFQDAIRDDAIRKLAIHATAYA